MSPQSSYSVAFEAFGASCAAAAIQQQDALSTHLGARQRQADLANRTLRADDQTIGGVTSLGSFSHVSQTWLWTWENPHFDWDHPAVAPLRAVHAYGEEHRIPELTTGHLDLSGFANPHQAATTMAIAAGSLLGGNGIWTSQINDGKGSAYVHLDDPQLPTAGFDPVAVSRLLTAAVQVFPADHRRVVRGYFDRHRVQYEETADQIVANPPQGSPVTVAFDANNRLAQISSVVV